MEKRFRRWAPGQAFLLPPSVDDFVPAGHAARLIRDLVSEELDLGAILGSYDNRRGQPPYHPVMMTALLLYAYTTGVYSSRRIARACIERVDFMAVTAMEQPDFRTVSAFRKRHLGALQGLFVQVLKLCQRAGLVKLGHVALDGTKVQANASKHKAMSYDRMCAEEKRLKAEVAEWMRRAQAIDDTEDEQYGADKSGDEVPEWMKNKQQRLAKIREAKAALEREAREEAESLEGRAAVELTVREREVRRTKKPPPRTQRNFTDPESRILKDAHGFVQGYNCQAAVEAGSQVIVARQVSNRQNDAEHLVGMVEQIRSNLNGRTFELSADNGYCSEDNLRTLARRRIRGYVATGRQRHGQGPSEPSRRGSSHWIKAMTARLRRGGFRSRYRLRKQTVEPVFGQIKAARGFVRFLLRGLEQVAGEWSLVCTAHNLRKLTMATS